MNDVLGVLIVGGLIVFLLVTSLRDRPASVAQRRHARYQRRFADAKTPAEQAQHAQGYLADVIRAADDATTAAIAKEVFALAVKRNGAGATLAGPPQVTARKTV